MIFNGEILKTNPIQGMNEIGISALTITES